jgi:hypothetical protein
MHSIDSVTIRMSLSLLIYMFIYFINQSFLIKKYSSHLQLIVCLSLGEALLIVYLYEFILYFSGRYIQRAPKLARRKHYWKLC